MEWELVKQLEQYQPENKQEEADRKAVLQAAGIFQKKLLFRENACAHLTSSGFVVNPEQSRVLLVHHNLRNTWSWPGGHADGEEDLLAVAMRETKEETGVQKIVPLTQQIASLDIFPVERHIKHGMQISPHLHFSVSYFLVCAEEQLLQKRVSENGAARWFPLEFLNEENFGFTDAALYRKLTAKLKRIAT